MCEQPQGVALFGGTFDPVHQGHLQPLQELLHLFAWQRVELLPTCLPPHRVQPEAAPAQRWHMLTLATAHDARLHPNDWELRRGEPSRTLHTLQHFQSPDTTLFFIMGMDSLLSLPSWLAYETLLQLTNFVVLPRPGYDISQASPTLQAILTARQTCEPFACYGQTGRIYLAQTDPVAISATRIRHQIACGKRPPELDPAVYQYIKRQGLYGA